MVENMLVVIYMLMKERMYLLSKVEKLLKDHMLSIKEPLL